MLARSRSLSFASDRNANALSNAELVCFSHLRWDFVWQRPQHLLSRAAKIWPVLYIEEPVFKSGVRPRINVSARPGSITVAVPTLPEGINPDDGNLELRNLVGDLSGARREGLASPGTTRQWR